MTIIKFKKNLHQIKKKVCKNVYVNSGDVWVYNYDIFLFFLYFPIFQIFVSDCALV